MIPSSRARGSFADTADRSRISSEPWSTTLNSSLPLRATIVRTRSSLASTSMTICSPRVVTLGSLTFIASSRLRIVVTAFSSAAFLIATASDVEICKQMSAHARSSTWSAYSVFTSASTSGFFAGCSTATTMPSGDRRTAARIFLSHSSASRSRRSTRCLSSIARSRSIS